MVEMIFNRLKCIQFLVLKMYFFSGSLFYSVLAKFLLIMFPNTLFQYIISISNVMATILLDQNKLILDSFTRATCLAYQLLWFYSPSFRVNIFCQHKLFIAQFPFHLNVSCFILYLNCYTL